MARKDHTEYGGGEGEPQRFEDGSAKELNPSERAAVLRKHFGAARSKGNEGALTPEEAKALGLKTNGYGADGLSDVAR